MNSDRGGLDEVSLHSFTHLDDMPDIADYIRALEIFDAQKEMQELKSIAIERTGVSSGTSILDVGCGFGLETLRLAQLLGPGERMAGIDKSASFIAEAQRRAAEAGRAIDFRQGDAMALPYTKASFDIGRAERLLIYLDDPERAISELRRVVRAGGRIALIEPDVETNTINVDDRTLVRRILRHECDVGVPNAWLVRRLGAMLEDLGFTGIEIATRVVIFDQALAAGYFAKLGVSARQAGVIGDEDLAHWTGAIAELRGRGRLFCTIGYFLFTAIRA
ncbi:MAG: Methyltransferase type 11 [Xanthobacteraceae bacterium]|jgi:SAM-dependent methyltransferase|nr:Methyltransferase type 11 [Xanthobacteraceae bacterium]